MFEYFPIVLMLNGDAALYSPSAVISISKIKQVTIYSWLLHCVSGMHVLHCASRSQHL